MSISQFRKEIFKIVNRIPKGNVLTYKEVARLAGRPGAYRAVGNILNKNHDSAVLCHRVVRSDGKIGGYNRGKMKKKELLEKEGVVI